MSQNRPTVLGISGSLSVPSRTSALLRAVLARFGSEADATLLELADVAPVVFGTLPKGPRTTGARALIESVETADLLVVGSPVYRASYTGALKHLFDLVDHRALQGTPVLLCATGGTPLHGLMIDHQFRPLFAFFKALALPTAIYALETDFEGPSLRGAEISARIDRAAAEARQQLSLRGPGRSGTVLPLAANA